MWRCIPEGPVFVATPVQHRPKHFHQNCYTNHIYTYNRAGYLSGSSYLYRCADCKVLIQAVQRICLLSNWPNYRSVAVFDGGHSVV